MYYLTIAIPAPLRHSFDYLPPEEDSADCHLWPPGIRIHVPFGQREVIGILLAVQQNTTIPHNKLKTAIKRLDEKPLLPPSLLQLSLWMSDYYHHPIGEVLLQVLPKALRSVQKNSNEKNILFETQNDHVSWIDCIQKDRNHLPTLFLTDPLTLNHEQEQAVKCIQAAQNFTPFLLDGITGSGKTEVYFHCIAAKLAVGQQVLVLVPEIALTPQMVQRFQTRFNVPMVLLHSNLSEQQRAKAWLQAYHGQAAIIIGTRSAIFTPLIQPGLIILDEEHDLSFKQQSGLRYSARDCALLRAQLENIPIILGSATPSLESLYNCKRKRYQHLLLQERAGRARPPNIHLIDLRLLRVKNGLTKPLLEKINQHLAKKQQVLIFLNRRGYSPLLFCHQCGWMAECQHCDARLTLHLNLQRLFCHHCGASQKIYKQCPKCSHHELLNLGLGTERIEETLKTEFPDAHIVRIDRDSTRRKGSLQKLLDQVYDETADILVGTQMLAKGHHFPKLTLVAIIDADSGLFSSDFRSLERMAQLLIQVAGRAGRSDQDGEVIIQTHQPQHPLLQLLLTRGYRSFAFTLLQERQQASLPPFCYFALLRSHAKLQAHTEQFLFNVKKLLEETSRLQKTSIEILGPIPALMERRANQYHAQLLIQSHSRQALQQLLRMTVKRFNDCISISSVRWSLDIDPQEMY